MSKFPKVGVAIFILKDGKFLMAQRMGSHGHGTWSIPGGHLEFGESIEDAAVREVFEETGVRVENIRFVAVTNDIFSKDKHYISIWVKAQWVSGKPKATDSADNFRWHTLKDLPSPLFEPCWQNLLKQSIDLS